MIHQITLHFSIVAYAPWSPRGMTRSGISRLNDRNVRTLSEIGADH
ncbi:hypothetical protein ACP8HI_08465 [Paenibacillus sp. FA6]